MDTFPTFPGRTYPFVRSPEWQNLVHRAVSGKRNAIQLWTAPIYHYSIPFSFLRSATAYAELQTMIAFYNSQGGDAQVFQFADPNDGTVTAQSFGTGDGVTTQFQLVRSFGGFVEPVFIPDITDLTVAGVSKSSPADYTESGGLITFTVAPALGAALAWTGTFNWPCRFDMPKIDFSQFVTGYWELQQLAFSTEPL